MLEIRTFQADDASVLIGMLQPGQRSENIHSFDQWERVADAAARGSDPAFTGVRRADGELLGAAGLMPLWRGRASAWALLSASIQRADMIPIHRAILWFLNVHQGLSDSRFRRIETTVRQDWPQAHRWARMLGFQQEGILRCFDIEGHDYAMYARVNHG